MKFLRKTALFLVLALLVSSMMFSCKDKENEIDRDGWWLSDAGGRPSTPDDLPDDIDFLTGAMLEPLACCIHAIYDCCHIEAGDLVLVSGPGAIGLMAAQTAKAAGARVVVTGTDADTERLRMAVELGSDYAVNIQRENADELIERLSGGWGADVVLECSGSEAAVRSGMKLLKKRGWYCQIGLTGRPIPFDIETICYKELHFSGSMASRYLNWEKGMQLIRQGLVKLAPLASHHFRLDDWEEAFRMFREKKGHSLCIIPYMRTSSGATSGGTINPFPSKEVSSLNSETSWTS